MNWERVNIWTNTLYTLIQSIEIAHSYNFGDLKEINENIKKAALWTPQMCSYPSILLSHPFGNQPVNFRRDPNDCFREIINQIIKMLIQDLTVIFDEMLSEALELHQETAGNFPQSKIEKLSKKVHEKHKWSVYGCLELVAIRNVLTHGNGKWTEKSIDIVKLFIFPNPIVGQSLIIGFPMLFKFRKAIRTFLNEVVPNSMLISKAT